MNTSTARFAATVAATSALLLGVGLGANAIARSGDDPTSTAPLGDAVTVESTPTPSTDDRTSTPEASSTPTEVSHSPEVEDLDDDHGTDSSRDGDDDRVALPPNDDRIDDLSTDDGAGHDANDDRVTGVDDSHDDSADESDDDGHDDDRSGKSDDDSHDDEPEIEHEKD